MPPMTEEEAQRRWPVLTRPLVAGDVEQIKAIKAWREEVALEAEEHETLEEGKLGVWSVCYSVRREKNAIVLAKTREEAEELVEEERFGDDDLEIEEVVFERVETDSKTLALGPHVMVWG